MALVQCPECKNQVSDTAFKCPSCGARLRKPRRTVFGKICLGLFIVFNVIMALWLFGGVHSNVQQMQALSGAHKTGAALGTTIGAMLILLLWALGDVILGLFTFFTRPRVS